MGCPVTAKHHISMFGCVRWKIFIAAIALALICHAAVHAAAAASYAANVGTTQPVRIIFDTDMGSDCDDAGALAILHKLADRGEIKLLGVIFSSGRNPYGAGVCDAIDTYYGRGDLPLGQYHKTDVGDPVDRYCHRIATDTKTFPHDIVDSAPDFLHVYRDLLRAQPDHSVTILTTGHPHALAYLMDDVETSGLVRRKVQRWVAMAIASPNWILDWNFGHNGAEKYVGRILKEWPTPAYISTSGEQVLTGNRKLPATSANNPVREAFRLFMDSLIKGRPSWDEIAVLYAARPYYFKVEAGAMEQDAKGRTRWTSGTSSAARYRVTPIISNDELAGIIEDLISAPSASGH